MAMDALLGALVAKARNAHEKATAERLVAALAAIGADPLHVPPAVAAGAQDAYTALADAGFWAPGDADGELVRRYVRGAAPDDDIKFSIAPDTDAFARGEAMDRAYFLHVLATTPEAVLPPGKTLVSALALIREDARAEDAPAPAPTDLHAQVEQVVHRAFWDEAVTALSSPSPAAQLSRIKALQTDLHTALAPLFPPTHPVLSSLRLPLAPTSAPLRSYALALRAAAAHLRARCAPARDVAADALLALDAEADARGVVAATRGMMQLAEAMRADLAHALLGRMQEDELAAYVRAQATARERAIVGEHWSRTERIHAWAAWTAGSPWRARIAQCLGASAAVSCALPIPGADQPPSANGLPPQLLFAAPALLRAQNAVQALVVAAALRALGAPAARVLALLREDAKLDALADEVVRARGGDEGGVRGAVARTLRAEDPAFALLRGRVVGALAAALDAPVETRMDAPDAMRTGRAVLAPAPLRTADGVGRVPPVVGFEDACLREGLDEILRDLEGVVRWTEHVWPEVLEAR